MNNPGGPLQIAFLVGAAIVINVLWRLGERIWQGRHTRRDHSEWMEDVRHLLFQLCNVEVERADLLLNLAENLQKCPAGYEGVARDSLARSLVLVPAAAQMAETMGLFPPGTFSGMGVLPGPQAAAGPTPEAAQAPQPRPLEPEPEGYTVVGTQVIPLRAVS